MHALADNGTQLGEENIEELMQAYDNLSTFADVDPALTRIATDPNIQAVIFSNGTKTMILNSVLRSADLSPHASAFQDVITVDEVQQSSVRNNLWLVSGNPFDIVGARSTGMQAIWVDRVGEGWKDAASPDLQPTATVHSLEQVMNEIQRGR